MGKIKEQGMGVENHNQKIKDLCRLIQIEKELRNIIKSEEECFKLLAMMFLKSGREE